MIIRSYKDRRSIIHGEMDIITQGLINSREKNTSMGESGGHFENGRWVENTPEEQVPSEPQENIEVRLRSAAGLIGRGIDELLSAGSDLISSQEGRQHLGRKLDQITGDVVQVCEEIRREGIEFINQARDRIIK